jgi:hypothetical protein
MKSLDAKIIALAALGLALVATPALAQRLHRPAAGYVATQSVPAEHYPNGAQRRERKPIASQAPNSTSATEPTENIFQTRAPELSGAVISAVGNVPL